MSLTLPAQAMTLAEVRAEMDSLVARRNQRGAFHPAEYWRWKDLARVEESLLGIQSRL